MRPIARHAALVLLGMSALAGSLSGCAETTQESLKAAPAPTFLPAPSLLQAGAKGQVDRVYTSPTASWASYDKILLEPVTIWTGSGSNMDKASQAEQQALANAFYSALYDAAAKRCQMVTKAGPGTMRWRVALVDAASANVFLNTLSTYEPHVRLLDMLAGIGFNKGVAYWSGQATAEAYARDATTGALLWEGADARAGTKALRRDTFDSWDDVDNAFQAWGTEFANRLAALGACPGAKKR